MQKETQTDVVHLLGLGEGQTLPDEASESLAQGVVPPLDRRRPAGLFAPGRVLRGRDDQLVRFPEVAVTMTTAIEGGDARLKLSC